MGFLPTSAGVSSFSESSPLCLSLASSTKSAAGPDTSPLVTENLERFDRSLWGFPLSPLETLLAA